MKLFRLRTFVREHGHCWVAPLPTDIANGDREGSPNRSPLLLFENGSELGPAHAVHAHVREVGRGAYSHWESQIYLSSSDNSSPLSNGREYWAVAPSVQEAESSAFVTGRDEASRIGSAVPSNYAWKDASIEKINADADYAIGIAKGYAAQIPGGAGSLAGKSVLELGPGWGFATTLILRCWGASRVAVADRFLSRFQPEYHTALYREVSRRLRTEDPNCTTWPLDRCVEEGRHSPDAVQAIECPIERLPELSLPPFDFLLSNAVLEHVFHPARAAASLHAITAEGGLGFHQVDFRDHRDFSRPLEYLLLDEFSFLEIFEAQHGECGNRIRPSQLKAVFEAAGFGSVQFDPNMWAEPDYLVSLLPRLRAAESSPYCNLPESELRQISGRILTVK